MKKFIMINVLFLPLCFVVNSESSDLFSISQNIKAICQQGTSHNGYESKLSLNHRNYNFTKEEWEGIQRVLKKDQLYDNKDYRDCVESIAKLFVTRYRSLDNEQLTGTEYELKEMRESRKNKKIRDKIRPRY